MTGHQREDRDERPEAVRQAAVGAAAWRTVVHVQGPATPAHADFYALAGELVATLLSVASLARVLRRQVESYPDGLAPGEVLYDDTRLDDPYVRLSGAVLDLDELTQAVEVATSKANRFWTAMGHLGVEHAPGEGEARR